MKCLALVVLLSLAACTNTNDPILREQAGCIQGHFNIVLIPIYHSNGRGGGFTTLQPMPVWNCDQPIWFVRPNPNYKRSPA